LESVNISGQYVVTLPEHVEDVELVGDGEDEVVVLVGELIFKRVEGANHNVHAIAKTGTFEDKKTSI
jgi:hypothetical protein